jgi:RNA polymerase sigma-70 factor (ECF subfamily)
MSSKRSLSGETISRHRSFGATTDISLIDRVRMDKEDQASWHQFMDIYRPLVTHWCRRINIKSTDTEDVCQDVFTSVLMSINRFNKVKETDTFRGWLRTITRCRIVDYLRRKTHEVPAMRNIDIEAEVAPLVEPEELSDSDNESRKASRDVLRAAVKAVQDRSDDNTWQAFIRTAVDDQNATDVAKELGMNSDAVRQAKSRVTKRLQKALGPLFDEIVGDAGVSLEE